MMFTQVINWQTKTKQTEKKIKKTKNKNKRNKNHYNDAGVKDQNEILNKKREEKI